MPPRAEVYCLRVMSPGPISDVAQETTAGALSLLRRVTPAFPVPAPKLKGTDP